MPPSPFGPRCLGPFASDPRRGAVSRRSLVQAGTLGLAGFGVAGGTVGLPDLLAARVVAMGEGPQAGGGGVFAQQGEEAVSGLVVDGPGIGVAHLNPQRRGWWTRPGPGR